jgi:electron-transferring-flavoprotein dehydrogenase
LSAFAALWILSSGLAAADQNATVLFGEQQLASKAQQSGSLAAYLSELKRKSFGYDYEITAQQSAALRDSWIAKELKLVKNAEPAVAKFGGDLGTVVGGIDMWMRTLKIGLPITMGHHRDYEQLQRADLHRPIDYPKPDGEITFDRLTSVSYSYTNHAEDQPNHLKLKDPALQLASELAVYAGPSTRYCPAGVYEWLADEDTGEMKFQINSQNCVHCKTCDIKDPNQNIEWTTPEGGGGPNYPNM